MNWSWAVVKREGYDFEQVALSRLGLDIASLRIETSGAGSVDYYGQPSVSQSISGVGCIKSLGVK